jgi:hypothetical protein
LGHKLQKQRNKEFLTAWCANGVSTEKKVPVFGKKIAKWSSMCNRDEGSLCRTSKRILAIHKIGNIVTEPECNDMVLAALPRDLQWDRHTLFTTDQKRGVFFVQQKKGQVIRPEAFISPFGPERPIKITISIVQIYIISHL